MTDLKAKLALAKLKSLSTHSVPVVQKPAAPMLNLVEEEEELFPNISEMPAPPAEVVTVVDIHQHLKSFTVSVGVKLSKNYNSYDSSFSATFDYPHNEEAMGGALIDATKKWVANHCVSQLEKVFNTISPKLEH